METTDKFLTVRQAAELLGCSPETVIRWILHEGLPAERIRFRSGRHRYRLLRSNVLAFLEAVQAKRQPPARRGYVSPETIRELAKMGLTRIGGDG